MGEGNIKKTSPTVVEELLPLVFGVFEYREMFMDTHVDTKKSKHNSCGFVQPMLIIHGKPHQIYTTHAQARIPIDWLVEEYTNITHEEITKLKNVEFSLEQNPIGEQERET